jgi:hypothetical protein
MIKSGKELAGRLRAGIRPLKAENRPLNFALP